MAGSEIALDTTVAIAVLNGTGDAGAWIQGFTRVCLPVTAVGELRFGALNSGRVAQNLARIEALVASCDVLTQDLDTAATYARLRLDLRRRGRPLPENDIWIAAACVQHAIPLVPADAHFHEIGELAVVPR
jgi:tRNA(fMet)-specific endonuclease VapC